MSFATRIAANSISPIYLLEFEGDEINASDFDAVTNWTLAADGANKAADATDAKAGAASIGWDKTGTASTGANMDLATTAFNISDHAYLTIMVKAPTVTAGTILQLNMIIGQDVTTNRYKWVIPWGYFTSGAWHRLYLSINELDAGFTSFAAEGSVVATGLDSVRLNWQGTSSACTYTGCRVDALRGHPYRYSTGEITTPRADTKSWLQLPDIQPQSYRPSEGVLSLGGASGVVVDGDGATVLSDLSTYAFEGRSHWYRMGWRGVAEDADGGQWETIFRGVIESVPHKGKAWQFGSLDHLRLFDRPIMQDATEAAPVTITGHPLTVFLQLATSTGNGGNGDYDVLTSVRGAGISTDLFDISQIEDERDTWMPLDACSFTFTAPETSLLSWFFREVCKGFGIVPKVQSSGALSVRVVRPPFGTSTTDTLGTDNVIQTGGIPEFSIDRDRIYNQVRILYDWNSTTEKFASDTADTYQDADSIALYGLRELVIESKGLVTSSIATVGRVARRYLTRVANGAPPVSLQAFHTVQQLQLGDLVSLTVPRTLPDLTAGTYGTSALLVEIEGRGFNPATGACHLDTGVSSYQAGNYRKIGPTSLTTDYDASTSTQRGDYLFIADASDFLGAANDPAHQIGPG